MFGIMTMYNVVIYLIFLKAYIKDASGNIMLSFPI